MPVTAAAVCPHPPLLIPELAAGAAPELATLRTACRTAINRLTHSDLLVVVGTTGPTASEAVGLAQPGDATGSGPAFARAAGLGSSVFEVLGLAGVSVFEGDAGGSFAAYGAPGVRVGDGDAVLPLALAVGGWLLERSEAVRVPRMYVAVPDDLSPVDCLALGEEIASGNERVGLLVMGDGSARRSDHSPVHLHPRAEVFDSTVARALQDGDVEVLAALDPELARVLQAAGRAPWQVLAGALGPLESELLYDAAPYGVGYFVASFG